MREKRHGPYFPVHELHPACIRSQVEGILYRDWGEKANEWLRGTCAVDGHYRLPTHGRLLGSITQPTAIAIVIPAKAYMDVGGRVTLEPKLRRESRRTRFMASRLRGNDGVINFALAVRYFR